MKSILTLTIILTTSITLGQNLVPNPSFESFICCPTTDNQLSCCSQWSVCGAYSPDYYNSCSTSTLAGVPVNWQGNRYPATGQGYCGMYCYSGNHQGLRENIIAQLTSPMIIGQRYNVQFKVCSGDSLYSSFGCSNKIGARFSTGICPTGTLTDNFAHVYTNTIITNKMNWVTVSGSFIADSAYSYMRLGNFFDDANTNAIPAATGHYSYYYIDDVDVFADPTGLKDIPFENLNYTIYPNPAKDVINIEFNNFSGSRYSLTLFDMYQKSISEIKDIKTSKTSIDIHNLSKGVYFLQVKSESNVVKTNLLTIIE